MSLSSLEELVSQADREGVTLAEVIARSMTTKEMNVLQRGLTSELEDNYAKISDFMGDIETSSMVDMEGMSIQQLMGLRDEIMQRPSDESSLVEA